METKMCDGCKKQYPVTELETFENDLRYKVEDMFLCPTCAKAYWVHLENEYDPRRVDNE